MNLKKVTDEVIVDDRLEEAEEVDAVVWVAVEVEGDHREGAVEEELEDEVHVVLEGDVELLDEDGKDGDDFGVAQFRDVVFVGVQDLNQRVEVLEGEFGVGLLEDGQEQVYVSKVLRLVFLT